MRQSSTSSSKQSSKSNKANNNKKKSTKINIPQTIMLKEHLLGSGNSALSPEQSSRKILQQSQQLRPNKLNPQPIFGPQNGNRFEPFKIPPSYEQAKLHRHASQFGVVSTDLIMKEEGDRPDIINPSIPNPPQFCLCCGQSPKTKLPLCCKISQVYSINYPVGYYFTYIKVMCFLLLFITASVGIYSFIEILHHCGNNDDKCTFIYGIPVPKFHIFFTDILIYMNVGIIVLIYAITAYLYFQNAKIHYSMIIDMKKASDYAVLLSGIDHQLINGGMLKEHFRQYEIEDIIYTHKVSKYVQKLAKKSTLQAKLHLYFKKDEKNHKEKIEKVKKKITKIDNQVLHVKNKLNLCQQVDLRTDKIIIKFTTTKDKLRFEEKYKAKMYENIYHTFCGGSLIVINDVPLYIEPIGQPHQIAWENLQLMSKDRYIRVLFGNVVTLMILGASYLLVTLMTRIQHGFEGTGDIIFAVMFALVVEAINFLLDITIEKITEWQKRYTLTGKITIILIKNVISFFFNTTLIPFSLFLFDWGSSTEEELVRNIFTLFLISNFISPFISVYMQPKYLYKLHRRKKVTKEGNDCLLTQIKANETFEKVGFQLNLRYSLVIQRITNCMFYAAVFPVGIVITFIGLILTYWTSKWWLVNYCSIPKYSFRLGKVINDLTTFFPCIYAFGYSANLYMIPQNVEFDRLYSIFIALATIPISLLFLMFGNSIALSIVKRINGFQISRIGEERPSSSVAEHNAEGQMNLIINNGNMVADYRQLNPTTFLHYDLHDDINKSEFEGMWGNLLSYVINHEVRKLQPRNGSSIIIGSGGNRSSIMSNREKMKQ